MNKSLTKTQKSLQNILKWIFLLIFLISITPLSAPITQALSVTDGMNASDEIGEYIGTTPNTGNSFTTGSLRANAYGSYGSASSAVDTVNHRLFISDFYNNRVLVFNLDSSNNLVDRAADYVLGQTDTSTVDPNYATANQSNLYYPQGLTFDSSHNRLFVADTYHNRVLVFNTASLSNNMNASYVLGQANFTSSGSATTQVGMKSPSYLEYDSANDRLFVSDEGNNRVLFFYLNNIANGLGASYVLGQNSFTTGTTGLTQNTLNAPKGLAYYNTSKYLFVADSNNHRIMIFSITTPTTGANASYVFGQTDFVSNTMGTTASTLKIPQGLTIGAGTTLYASDDYNYRVLQYNFSSFSNGKAASKVLGQSTFTTGNLLPPSSSSLWVPSGLNFDSGNNRLYISDKGNNRLIVQNVASITNGQAATDVIGQYDQNYSADFTKRQPNNYPDPYTFYNPHSVAFDTVHHRLFVGDNANGRVLVYTLDNNNNLTNKTPTNVLGQASFYASQRTLVNASTISSVYDLAYDSVHDRLFVADGDNNRVLVFNTSTINDGMNAINVIGQSSLTTSDALNTQSGMSAPYGVEYDSANDRLFVANSQRVLVFNTSTITNGMNASYVIGQSNFTNGACSLTAAGNCYPTGLAYDSANNRLYVSDGSYNRILVYNLPTTMSNGLSANYVLGQTSFTTSTYSPVSSSSLYGPAGLFFDSTSQKLFAADNNNNRVVIYDVSSLSNGKAASNVLGQTSFSVSTGGTSQGKINSPQDVSLIPGVNKLYIADESNQRIMIYDLASPPGITSVSPNYGPVAGGTSITITGTNLTSDTTVTIGGVAATNIVYVNPTTLTAVTPAGTAGSKDVVVTNSSNTATLTNGFTYRNPPSITGISPIGGNPAGGTVVTISGTDFYAGATVKFDGISATNVSVSGGTTITATSPAHAVGAVDVLVTNPDGQSATRSAGYTYANPPTITGISVSNGTQDGGTDITITGTNFVQPYYGVPGTPGTSVYMSSTNTPPYSSLVPFTVLTIVDSTTIVAKTPAHTAGTTYVVVSNPDTQKAVSSAYTYNPAPSVTGLSVTQGSTTGGTQLSVYGSNFMNGATVTVGGQSATATFVSSGAINITTPAGTAGAKDVVVTNPDGQQGTLSGGFTYVAPPSITSFSPSSGPTSGGTTVAVYFSNLSTGYTVTWDGNPISTGSIYNGNHFFISTPAHAAGTVNLVITNTDGQSASAAFTYNAPPTITSISPSSGSVSGNTLITISGTGFVPGATVAIVDPVSLQARSATSVSVLNSTTITARTPSNTAKSYNVTVTNPDNQSATLNGGYTYVYPAPTISLITPSSGSTIGGTHVQIAGSNFNDGLTLSVDGMACNGCYTLLSTSLMNAIMPSHATAGPVDISITNPDNQTATLSNGYTYIFPPTVTSVSPDNGLTTGGTSVTITGDHFQTSGTVSVKFGGIPASSINVVNGTTITAVTPATIPAKTAGPVSVTVTNPDNQVGTLNNGFTYNLPLSVSVITPNYGRAAGGSTITFTGVGFQEGSTLTFGGNPATITNVSADGKSMTATTPAYPDGGRVNVVLTTPDNETVTVTNGFTYLLPPTFTSLSKISGKASGGDSVTIRGTNFASPTVVFGGQTVQVSGVLGGTELLAFATPAHDPGPVDITITNVDGQSVTANGVFTYDLPPTINSITPNHGSTRGNTSVTISGSNFVSGATVNFRNTLTNAVTSATAVNVVDDGTITAKTPAGADAVYDVTVVNPDGQPVTLPESYTYISAPSLTSISVAGASTRGGVEITLNGDNFESGSVIKFDGIAATYVSNDDTSIKVILPSHPVAGAVQVSVTNPDNQTATLPQPFTYYAPPEITSVDPAYTTIDGGNSVNITGRNFRTGDIVQFGLFTGTITSVTSTRLTVTVPTYLPQGYSDISVTSPSPDSNEVATLPNSMIVYPSGPVRVIAHPGTNTETFILDPGVNQEIAFNKPLTSASKTAVENAITASNSNKLAAYSWNDLSTILTIHNGASYSYFNNNVYAVSLTDVFGTTADNVLLIKSIPQSNQTEINDSISLAGNVTQVVVNKNVSTTVTIPSDITSPVINVKPLYINNSATVPALTINASTSGGNIDVVIPANTRIVPTDNSWDGQLPIANRLPDVIASGLITMPQNQAPANVVAYSMGPDNNTLSLSHAVRMKFYGMGAKTAGYFENGTFHQITTECTDDTQAANDAMGGHSECRLRDGANLLIWTNHFTDFIFYDIQYPPVVSSATPVLISGGNVTITGSNFGTGALVFFGGVQSTNVTVDSGTQITALAPAHVRGQVDIEVMNLNNLNDTLVNGLTYADIPSPPIISTVNTSGNGANVTWVAPADDGGTALTGYAIRYGKVSDGCQPNISATGCQPNISITTTDPAFTALSKTISNLSPNTDYSFAVIAYNGVGSSLSGALTLTTANTNQPASPSSNTNATQNISCNSSTGNQSFEVRTPAYPDSNTVAFQTRTTDFYNTTNAPLDSNQNVQLYVTDDRGYDPSAMDCGVGYSYTIQSNGLYLNGNTTSQRLGLRLGQAVGIEKFAWDMVFGPNSPINVADVFNADVTAPSEDISTAVQVTHTSEAFLGRVILTLDGSDLEVIKPAASIPAGSYAGTITFTQI